MIFLFLFIFPFIEIAVVFNAIKVFGFTNAFFAWMFATILGVGLLRSAGPRLAFGVAQSLRQGQSPAPAAIDGALIAFAGLLFLIPGYISDVFALILLFPPTRTLVRLALVGAVFKKFVSRFSWSSQTPRPPNEAVNSAHGVDAAHDVIDVDAVVVEDDRRSKGHTHNKS